MHFLFQTFFRVLRNGLWRGIQQKPMVRCYASSNLKDKTIGVIGLGQAGNKIHSLLKFEKMLENAFKKSTFCEILELDLRSIYSDLT